MNLDSTVHRCFVIDTSVLLADPGALERFEEHDVVVPLVVIAELEAKRHHPELGYTARAALRYLETCRQRVGSLVEPFPVGDGGSLRVELNHVDTSRLPDVMRTGDNDSRILAVADDLARSGADVVVVTKDLPLRLKASLLGLGADEYRNELAAEGEWTGIVEMDCDSDTIDHLYSDGAIDLEGCGELPVTPGWCCPTGRTRRSPDSGPTSGFT